MHKILLIMIYYIWSLAVHSAVLSYVLISTVSYITLCYALTRTHTYSPLRSTTHNSPLWSTLPYFHLYVWPAEYLRNPPVAWLVYTYKNLLTWDTDLYKFYTARINAYKICKYIYTSFGKYPLWIYSGLCGWYIGIITWT